MLGSRNALADDFRAVIAYLESGLLPIDDVITKTVSLDDAGTGACRLGRSSRRRSARFTSICELRRRMTRDERLKGKCGWDAGIVRPRLSRHVLRFTHRRNESCGRRVASPRAAPVLSRNLNRNNCDDRSPSAVRFY